MPSAFLVAFAVVFAVGSTVLVLGLDLSSVLVLAGAPILPLTRSIFAEAIFREV